MTLKIPKKTPKKSQKKTKQYISQNIDKCLKYDLDGLYIPSFNKRNLTKKLKLHKQTIIGSAHNHMEIRKKIEQGCKIITGGNRLNEF